MRRSNAGAHCAVLTVIASLLLSSPAVTGLEVYLRQLNIHQIRRIPVIEGDVSIYFQCATEGQNYLPKVKAKDEDYIWNSGDLALVSVSPRSCKACAFWEDRNFGPKKDDILGSQFQLCEVDFAETGFATKSAEDSFDASFECQECRAVSPPPPSPTAPAPPPDNQQKSRSMSGGVIAAVVGITVVSGIILGALGSMGYMLVRQKRKAQAQVAFEAALQEQGLGLDETFEQDAEAFHQSLLHPSAWYKLKDRPTDEE